MISRPATVGPSALVLVLTGLLALGCEGHAEPPGRLSTSARPPTLPRPTGSEVAEPAASGPTPNENRNEPGSGAKLASIAMRTWIYDAASEHGRKLGYLRAGAVIDRAIDSAGNDGCEGGWYRVAPRGFACVGKGASLDTQTPIVQAAVRGPRRGQPVPYDYVMSAAPPPQLYFKLPTEADQRRVEGATVRTHILEQRKRFEGQPSDPVPEFLLAGNNLPQPYGSEKNLSYSVHRGKAKDNSAFGLIAEFDWTDRRFGLTTELDLIALDRTKPATISKLHGVKLEEGGRPAFVQGGGTTLYREVNGEPAAAGPAEPRSGWELTGKNKGGETGLLETTTEGVWLPAAGLTIGEIRKDRASFADKGRKWISVSIKKQMLIAYEGEKPVYASLVSTGRGGLGDPAETTATIRGTFLIRAKHVSGTMDGDEASEDAFDLRDVPYIQYFHEGYALHAAYWHDDFGKERSHGCVNLPPATAAWLFDWTEPMVPAEWHGAVSPQGGTLVYVHP